MLLNLKKLFEFQDRGNGRSEITDLHFLQLYAGSVKVMGSWRWGQLSGPGSCEMIDSFKMPKEEEKVLLVVDSWTWQKLWSMIHWRGISTIAIHWRMVKSRVGGNWSHAIQGSIYYIEKPWFRNKEDVSDAPCVNVLTSDHRHGGTGRMEQNPSRKQGRRKCSWDSFGSACCWFGIPNEE